MRIWLDQRSEKHVMLLNYCFLFSQPMQCCFCQQKKKEEDKTTQGRLKIMEAFFLSIMGEYWRIVLGKTTKNN